MKTPENPKSNTIDDSLLQHKYEYNYPELPKLAINIILNLRMRLIRTQILQEHGLAYIDYETDRMIAMANEMQNLQIKYAHLMQEGYDPLSDYLVQITGVVKTIEGE